jgi:hypothetical protein
MKQTWIPVHDIRCHQPHVNFICTRASKCLISVRKMHPFSFILCYEFNSGNVNLLILKGDGHNYFVIIIIVIILQNLWWFFIWPHFGLIQNVIVNLETMSLSFHSFNDIFISQKPRIYYLHIKSDIRFRYATTLVTSKVANPANMSQEVKFDVTLPDEAYISDFQMQVLYFRNIA